MPARKNNLRIDHDGLLINADVRLGKVTEENVNKEGKIIRRDKKTGNRVKRHPYDKETEERLESGYGWNYYDEETGEQVPKERIEHYQVLDGDEKKVEKRDPTIGGGRTLEPVKWIPVHEEEQFLVEKTYEMWGEEPQDDAQLARLANYIEETGEAPVLPFLYQSGFFQKWAIVIPHWDGDQFALLLRITKQKVHPEHEMEKLSEDEIQDEMEKGDEKDKELAEQETPF